MATKPERAAEADASDVAAAPSRAEVSHNLSGQRLRRKGQETRERILRAALAVIERETSETPLTLSAITREASVGITTLYLYFPDIGEVVLAALGRVMETAEDAYADRLRVWWPDDRLEDCCLDFLRAHYRFWRRNARILHLRNSFADSGDARFVEYRNRVSYPLLGWLTEQMAGTRAAQPDGDPATRERRALFLAVALLTGFERLATVITTTSFHDSMREQGVEDEAHHIDSMLRVEARLLALGIADIRADAA